MTANERRYEGRTGLGGQKSLICGKAQGDVDQSAFRSQRLAGFQTIDCQWYLDADIVRNFAQDFGLFHHCYMVKRNDLR